MNERSVSGIFVDLPLEEHGADRQARRDLVLNAGRELPVVPPVEIAERVVANGAERATGRTRTNLVILRRCRRCWSAAAAPEHAVPTAFSRAVEPVAVLADDPDRRVGRGRVGVVLPMVFAVVRLQRRAAVAEQVVHRREARRVVGAPLQQPAFLREEPRRHEPARLRRCRSHARAEPLDAQARIERQPLDRPRVLQEQRRVVVDDARRLDRRVPDVHRAGSASGVVLIEIAVVRVGHAAVRADLVVVAELDAVRSGDVRHRPPDTRGACCPGAESDSNPRSVQPAWALLAAVNAHSSSTCRCVSVFLVLTYHSGVPRGCSRPGIGAPSQSNNVHE